MEQHSQTRDTPEARRVLESQLRECFGRVAYSHKTHEKGVDILLRQLCGIKLWQVVLSAVTTAGLIWIWFGGGRLGSILSALVSTVLLALNLYAQSMNLGEQAHKHRQTASNLWLIREKYLTLLTDVAMGEKPLEGLQTERDKILNELHAIYSNAPSTTSKAYMAAQKALRADEDLTFSDKEIDVMLPEDLRRTKRSQSN